MTHRRRSGRPTVERPTGLRHAVPRILLPVVLGAVIFFGYSGSANAATFPDDCSSAFDTPTCERVDYLAQRSDEIERLIGWGVGAVIFVGCVPVLRGITGGNT